MFVQNVQEVPVNLTYLFVYFYISLPDLATLSGNEYVTKPQGANTKSRKFLLIIVCRATFTISDISCSSVERLVASVWVHKNTAQVRG
jgi:hypothetical protein